MHIAEKLLSSLEFTSGCTEPAAIGLAAAWVGHMSPGPVERLHIALDSRTYKNAFSAGIPNGQGHTGTEAAAAFGLVLANPKKRLSLFLDLTPNRVTRAMAMVQSGAVLVQVQAHDRLTICATGTGPGFTTVATIENSHTHVTGVTVNGATVYHGNTDSRDSSDAYLNFCDRSYDPETWPALVETAWGHPTLRDTIEQGIACNRAAASQGTAYVQGDRHDLVTGAIYSRMTGDPVLVMSCAGSGNKGLTSIVPVLAEAEALGMDGDHRSKAVVLSTLVTSLVTARFGAVSSTCGVVMAAGAGLVAAFLYLRNRLDLFPSAWRNYAAAVAGAFCDGAKGSCAMRGQSAVQNARKAIAYAEQGFVMDPKDGFLGASFKETLDHLLAYAPVTNATDPVTMDILKQKADR